MEGNVGNWGERGANAETKRRKLLKFKEFKFKFDEFEFKFEDF